MEPSSTTPRTPSFEAHRHKLARRMGLLALGVYLLSTFGGIREADGEVVFKQAQALADRHSLAVVEDMRTFRAFGLAMGKDGRGHSIFGPGLAFTAAPAVLIAEEIDKTKWYDAIPVQPSFFIAGGLADYLLGRPPADPRPHALRALVSLINALIAAGCVWLFTLIAGRLASHPGAVVLSGGLFAFGTLLWSYSASFFSEPLAIFWMLAALYPLVKQDTRSESEGDTSGFAAPLAAGFFLGLSILAHISAILFAPFFFVYALGRAGNTPKASPDALPHRDPKTLVRPAIAFSLGLGLMLILLGAYNAYRFGSPLETGRTADLVTRGTFDYGRFVAPWTGLAGLLFSSGKGIFFYCPLVIGGLVFWPAFHRRFRLLSWSIGGAVVFRILFIASRSDWTGGLCLGPRYLLPAIPLLILPLIPAVERALSSPQSRRATLLFAFSLACILQQLYFSLSDINSYYFMLENMAKQHGQVLENTDWFIYTWKITPLIFMMFWKTAPWIFSGLNLNKGILFLILSVAAGGLYRRAWRRSVMGGAPPQEEPRHGSLESRGGESNPANGH